MTCDVQWCGRNQNLSMNKLLPVNFNPTTPKRKQVNFQNLLIKRTGENEDKTLFTNYFKCYTLKAFEIRTLPIVTYANTRTKTQLNGQYQSLPSSSSSGISQSSVTYSGVVIPAIAIWRVEILERVVCWEGALGQPVIYIIQPRQQQGLKFWRVCFQGVPPNCYLDVSTRHILRKSFTCWGRRLQHWRPWNILAHFPSP